MAKKDLSKRKIWQDYSGRNSAKAEHDFYNVFSKLLITLIITLIISIKINKIYIEKNN